MSQHYQISYRNIDHSDAIERFIQLKCAHLSSNHEGLGDFRIVMEAPHRRKAHGNQYKIRLMVHWLGKQLEVDWSDKLKHSQSDLYTAIQKAFDVLESRLDKKHEKNIGHLRRRTSIRAEHPYLNAV